MLSRLKKGNRAVPEFDAAVQNAMDEKKPEPSITRRFPAFALLLQATWGGGGCGPGFDSSLK